MSSHQDNFPPTKLLDQSKYNSLDSILRICPTQCNDCKLFNMDIADTPAMWPAKLKIKNIDDFENIILGLPLKTRLKIESLSVYSSNATEEGRTNLKL
jgi:hypothetical protein